MSEDQKEGTDGGGLSTLLGGEMAQPLTNSSEVGEEVNSPVSSEYHYSRNDWCRLLFQDGYIKVLKQLALSGELQRSNLRAVCWKLFLGVIPEEQDQWAAAITSNRDNYYSLKKKYTIDPHSLSSSQDPTVDNPLSLDDGSEWHKYFADSGLRQTLNQDIIRTHPDQMFFKQDDIQQMMMNVLFCYCKEHPDLGYRQGMHELLAPILFVLHAECRDDLEEDDSLRPELKVVMDPKHIEADASCMFTQLMEGMELFYQTAALEADHYTRSDKKGFKDPRNATPFDNQEFPLPSSSLSRKLDKIHDLLLKKADDQLYYRLKELAIPPQTYGIRWIRLLYSREFFLPCVLQLWDALFTEGTALSLVDYVFVALLVHVRETLLTEDYSKCMQVLMQFPPVHEIMDIVQRALHFKNPSQYPSPVLRSEWGQIRVEDIHLTSPQQQLTESTKAQRLASKTKQVFASAKNPFNKPMKVKIGGSDSGKAKEEKERATSRSDEETPFPPITTSTPSPVDTQEMVRNPKTRPRTDSSDYERLKEQLESSEAKCLYCGRKMEAILEEMQEGIEQLELTPETEDSILISLAGLKQVRDLLLHKLPFSGELLPDFSYQDKHRLTNDDEQVDAVILRHPLPEDKEEEQEAERSANSPIQPADPIETPTQPLS